MKILFLLDSDINSIGGSQTSVKMAMDVVREDGYDTCILMPGDNTGKHKNGQLLYSTQKNRLLNYFTIVQSIRKVAKTERPDIIHAHNPRVSIALGLCKKLRMIDPSIKCIMTDRRFFSEYTRMSRLLFKWLVPKFDLLMTTTYLNLKSWKENVIVKRIAVVTNALDDEWFEYSEQYEEKLKERNGGKINVCFAGRYEEYKRWDTALAISNELNKKYNDVMFSYAISSDKEHETEMNLFLDDSRVKLGESLHVIKDANRGQMVDFYYMGDIFILTSRNESFGKVLVEAMTKNNVVLGTRSGGVPDILKYKQYMFAVDDVEEAVKKISTFIEDSNARKKDSAYFLKYAKQNYNKEIMKKELLKNLKGLYE